MNVYDLDTLTLQLIRRPVEDDMRREYSLLFLMAYNEFYARIIKEKYRPFMRETVTIDRSAGFGLVTLSDLEKDIIDLICVETTGGERYPAENIVRYDTDRVAVHSPIEDEAVFVYVYMPPLLENDNPTSKPQEKSDTNTPIFPARYHQALSLYAAYSFLDTHNKKEEAQYMRMRALQLYEDIGNYSGIGCIAAGTVKLNIRV